MSAWFVIMSLLAAVNPARVAGSLSQTARTERLRPVAGGLAITAGAVLVLALVADGVLDLLDLTDETWRIASGAVAVLAGARHLSLRAATPLPELTRPVHALIPVAFPLLLVPELLLLAVLYGATETFGIFLLGAAVAFAAAAAWAGVPDSAANRGLARVFAAVLIVVGIGLLVAGIRDV